MTADGDVTGEVRNRVWDALEFDPPSREVANSAVLFGITHIALKAIGSLAPEGGMVGIDDEGRAWRLEWCDHGDCECEWLHGPPYDKYGHGQYRAHLSIVPAPQAQATNAE